MITVVLHFFTTKFFRWPFFGASKLKFACVMVRDRSHLPSSTPDKLKPWQAALCHVHVFKAEIWATIHFLLHQFSG
jgi:hypothetical protein